MGGPEQIRLGTRPGQESTLQLQGVGLFLFIPLVLFLFLRHPAPVGASLLAGIALVVVHRAIARPYMTRVLPVKCVWCNRALAPILDESTRTLDLVAAGAVIPARVCRQHLEPAGRFFTFLWAGRWPLRAGIFVPLILLLAALAAASFGVDRFLPGATALFRLVVAVTVNVAALGSFVVARASWRSPVSVGFPVHNFFLLGVRNLLWIFRLVGIWWLVLFVLKPWPGLTTP
jgi:hypothetical protein